MHINKKDQHQKVCINMQMQLNGYVYNMFYLCFSYNEMLKLNPQNKNTLSNKARASNILHKYNDTIEW